MRRVFSIILLPTVLAFGVCPARAGEKIVRAKTLSERAAKLNEGQPYIGMRSAETRLKEWKATAKKRGISLRKLAADELQAAALKKIVPVVITPSGKFRQTDKHNGTWAYDVLEQKTGVPMRLTVRPVMDYRGWDRDAYADDYVAKGFGRFLPSMEGKSPAEKVKSLPNSPRKLGNHPLRSVIDTAFERLKLEGEMFKDFIEIDIGRMLEEDKIYKKMRQAGVLKKGEKTLPNKKVFDRKIVKFVAARLKDQEMREFLIAHARTPDQVPKIEALLAQ